MVNLMGECASDTCMPHVRMGMSGRACIQAVAVRLHHAASAGMHSMTHSCMHECALARLHAHLDLHALLREAGLELQEVTLCLLPSRHLGARGGAGRKRNMLAHRMVKPTELHINASMEATPGLGACLSVRDGVGRRRDTEDLVSCTCGEMVCVTTTNYSPVVLFNTPLLRMGASCCTGPTPACCAVWRDVGARRHRVLHGTLSSRWLHAVTHQF